LEDVNPEEEKKFQVPLKYSYVEDELVDYMRDLIGIYSTHHVDVDVMNKDFLAE
jgi:hypothetical protein